MAEGKLTRPGTQFLSRAPDRTARGHLEQCEENLEALFALKHRIQSNLSKVPFVENDTAAVLAWYPTARTALLWNVSGEQTTIVVRCGAQRREVNLDKLESVLMPDLPA